MAEINITEERRQRLLGAMAESSIDAMLLYGNAWQGDYLRYGADFGILEGHGFALVSSAGPAELFLDSVVEAERAEVETSGAKVHFDPDVVRIVAARVDAAGVRLAAAPRSWPTTPMRCFAKRSASAAGNTRRWRTSKLTCAGAAVQTTS